MIRLPPLVEKELKSCGLPWLAAYGSRHTKIFVAGRLAAVVSRNGKNGSDRRNELNTRADLRRFIAQLRKQA